MPTCLPVTGCSKCPYKSLILISERQSRLKNKSVMFMISKTMFFSLFLQLIYLPKTFISKYPFDFIQYRFSVPVPATSEQISINNFSARRSWLVNEWPERMACTRGCFILSDSEIQHQSYTDFRSFACIIQHYELPVARVSYHQQPFGVQVNKLNSSAFSPLMTC